MNDKAPVLLPRKRQPSKKRMARSVECFLITMLFVIAVQGTYLAYMVGILTNLERRFGISSKKSGALLSFYDIGHTVSVVLIGFLATDRHLPRITAIGNGLVRVFVTYGLIAGALLSAISMFILALPTVLLGERSSDETSTSHELENILKNICDPSRVTSDSERNCELQEDEHFLAFCILTIGQILAGIAAAPFSTVAYVYVDNNLEDKTKSPFYLSLLSSTYAFAPGFGFALSAAATMSYTTIVDVPSTAAINSDLWWLGFIIFGLLYLLGAVPLMFFPKKLLQNDSNSFEMQQLRNGCLHDHDGYQVSVFENEERSEGTFSEQLKVAITEFRKLMKNRVLCSMIVAWMFGSYLTSGYSTYLPKYIETQFGRSASAADSYAGVISIGSIAVSTALGGYLLTKFNPSPRKALLFLIVTWSIIVTTYLMGAVVGCDEPEVKELLIASTSELLDIPSQWDQCSCADNGPVESGLYLGECNALFIYVAAMFTGLFFGNLFFMTTMMVVLRSVYDDEKVLTLSFASCITNIMGFIPGPIIFGWIIDEDCLLWHSRCSHDRGNCIVYDNKTFRQSFHLTSAGFQFLAVISVVICYSFSLTFTFPEEQKDDGVYDGYFEKQMDASTSRSQAVQTVL